MERLTRENVFNIFRESKRNKFKPPDLEVATAMISAKLAVESDQSLKNAVKNLCRSYTSQIQKQNEHHSKDRKNNYLGETVLVREDFTPLSSQIDPQEPPSQTKRKSFNCSKRQTQLKRTADILSSLNAFLEDEN